VSLVIEDLHKRFGSVVALDGVSFEVPTGQIFGFLGANGAGKTTTMRIALGVLRPDAGSITWNGIDHRSLPRPTWGYLPEERGLYPKMTVLQQLVFFAGLQGVPRDIATREARAWLLRFHVPDFADRPGFEFGEIISRARLDVDHGDGVTGIGESDRDAAAHSAGAETNDQGASRGHRSNPSRNRDCGRC